MSFFTYSFHFSSHIFSTFSFMLFTFITYFFHIRKAFYAMLPTTAESTSYGVVSLLGGHHASMAILYDVRVLTCVLQVRLMFITGITPSHICCPT